MFFRARSRKILVSVAEVRYILKYLEDNHINYASIEWSAALLPVKASEDLQIWHKLRVTEMPYGVAHEVPQQEEDIQNV